MPKAKETVLEIDLDALAHNYRYIRSKLHKPTMFLGVVKAFAYGSDAVVIARKLENLGIDYFAVAYVQEGVALRQAGIRTPILVLHPQAVNFETLIDYKLEPSLYSRKVLSEFLEAAGKKGQRAYPVHLKFNTGLNRLGFGAGDLEWVTGFLKGRDEVRIVSLFSHLAASEDVKETDFTKGQIARYLNIVEQFKEQLPSNPLRHILNTSGILNYPEAQLDMVRSGIGLYGYGNDPAMDVYLKPISTLKTIISQIHHLRPNESVGYNRAYHTGEPRVSATLPIGHADGIGRQYGRGLSFVYIGDQKVPIIGNVCMDMTMIDVTGVACQEGDEVILFGPGHSAENLAVTANTISYELITGISARVPRVFLGL